MTQETSSFISADGPVVDPSHLGTTRSGISVIIVSWNARAYLVGCLRSIFEQERSQPLEVIVVDNASSDGSPEAVRAEFPAVKLICCEQNYGFAKANNIGISASTGDYVFLINSDVVVHAGCFSKLMAFLDANPTAAVIGPRIIGRDGKPQRSCMSYPTLWKSFTRALSLDALFPKSRVLASHLMSYWQHDDTRDVDVINGCFWLIRRSALEQVGLLDETFFIYGEDVDWCKRFNDAGWRVRFFHDAEALHYGGASSANAPVRFYLEMQKAQLQYWEKHHTKSQTSGFLLISLLHHGVRATGEVLASPFRSRDISRTKISRNIATIKWVLARLGSSRTFSNWQSATQ